MAKNKYSWGERLFSFLASVLCICAVVLVLAIVIQQRFDARKDLPAQNAANIPSGQTTPAPMTLRAPSLPTQAPAETPAPERTPSAEEVSYDFLPVYTKADTNAKVIAITMDDCSHQGNVRAAAQAAARYGAKLTLFPLGQSVMSEGMAEVLQGCVYNLGFEIENRTWSDGLLYQLNDTAMAAEIWTADVAVDYVLRADYTMRFFRMRSGTGAKDVRTHEYLKQLGYEAIVNWTASSVNSDLDKLQKSLGPGAIFQFTSSAEDVEKMIALMKIADDQGYRMVTLSELLGGGANTLTPVEDVNAILTQTLPVLRSYEPVYIPHQIGDRSWQVYLIQSRLSELGYLEPGSADGIYGNGTSSAVSRFQADSGLMGTGVATTETQRALFAG